MQWVWVSPLLGERTKQKVDIAGSHATPAALEKVAKLDQLPKELGGTCDRCPEGCIKSDYGPWDASVTKRK